jgi:hypothetical protein
LKNKKNCSVNTFWNTVNNLLGRTKNEDMVLRDDDKTLSDEESAEAFAQFFNKKVHDLAAKCPCDDTMTNDEFLNARTKPFTREVIVSGISSFRPKNHQAQMKYRWSLSKFLLKPSLSLCTACLR